MTIPNPKGSIVHGSASEKVLEYLTNSSGVKFTESEIRHALKLERGQVSWALRHLSDTRRIEKRANYSKKRRDGRLYFVK